MVAPCMAPYEISTRAVAGIELGLELGRSQVAKSQRGTPQSAERSDAFPERDGGLLKWGYP